MMPDKTWGETILSWDFVEWMLLAGIFLWLWFKVANLIPQEKFEAWTEEYFGKFGGPILLWGFYISLFVGFLLLYSVFIPHWFRTYLL